MTNAKPPEISVIVTNFNHARYIEQAIHSILNQSLADFEVIIVDDCSTDDSRDVIEKLAREDTARIRPPIYLPKNSGKWFALNTGIASAGGSLIALQDADDASCPERLGHQRAILKYENSFHNLCGFTHCYSQADMDRAVEWKSPGGFAPPYPTMNHREVVEKVYRGFKTPGINHYFVGEDYEVHGASTLFYRQLWETGMKFLPGNMGLRCQKAEDSDHNTKMTLLLQKTSVLKEPLYAYRRNTSTNPAYLEGL